MAPTPTPTRPPASRLAAGRRIWREQVLLRHLLLAVLGLVAVYVVTYFTGNFRDSQIATAAYYVVALAGLTVLTGTNGQISLGHGGLLAVGAFTEALLATHDPHLPILLDLLICLAVTALVGVGLGMVAARLRGPYLAGVTLAFAVALPDLLNYWPNTFGGDTGLSASFIKAPAWFATLSIDHWEAYSFSLAAILVLVLLANLQRSGVGRAWRAVRDDELAAQLSGLHVARWQVLAFVVSAACAGLAGGLFAIVNSSVVAAGFPLTLSLSLLTGIVLGGLGSLTGAVWGALALVVLPELLTNAAGGSSTSNFGANLPDAIYGGLLIVLMLVAPGGIQGLLRRLGSLASRRGRTAPSRRSSRPDPPSRPAPPTPTPVPPSSAHP
jgi:branched-chain amino acid transport system permease protein